MWLRQDGCCLESDQEPSYPMIHNHLKECDKCRDHSMILPREGTVTGREISVVQKEGEGAYTEHSGLSVLIVDHSAIHKSDKYQSEDALINIDNSLVDLEDDELRTYDELKGDLGADTIVLAGQAENEEADDGDGSSVDGIQEEPSGNEEKEPTTDYAEGKEKESNWALWSKMSMEAAVRQALLANKLEDLVMYLSFRATSSASMQGLSAQQYVRRCVFQIIHNLLCNFQMDYFQVVTKLLQMNGQKEESALRYIARHTLRRDLRIQLMVHLSHLPTLDCQNYEYETRGHKYSLIEQRKDQETKRLKEIDHRLMGFCSILEELYPNPCYLTTFHRLWTQELSSHYDKLPPPLPSKYSSSPIHQISDTTAARFLCGRHVLLHSHFCTKVDIVHQERLFPVPAFPPEISHASYESAEYQQYGTYLKPLGHGTLAFKNRRGEKSKHLIRVGKTVNGVWRGKSSTDLMFEYSDDSSDSYCSEPSDTDAVRSLCRERQSRARRRVKQAFGKKIYHGMPKYALGGDVDDISQSSAQLNELHTQSRTFNPAPFLQAFDESESSESVASDEDSPDPDITSDQKMETSELTRELPDNLDQHSESGNFSDDSFRPDLSTMRNRLWESETETEIEIETETEDGDGTQGADSEFSVIPDAESNTLDVREYTQDENGSTYFTNSPSARIVGLLPSSQGSIRYDDVRVRRLQTSIVPLSRRKRRKLAKSGWKGCDQCHVIDIDQAIKARVFDFATGYLNITLDWLAGWSRDSLYRVLLEANFDLSSLPPHVVPQPDLLSYRSTDLLGISAASLGYIIDHDDWRGVARWVERLTTENAFVSPTGKLHIGCLTGTHASFNATSGKYSDTLPPSSVMDGYWSRQDNFSALPMPPLPRYYKCPSSVKCSNNYLAHLFPMLRFHVAHTTRHTADILLNSLARRGIFLSCDFPPRSSNGDLFGIDMRKLMIRAARNGVLFSRSNFPGMLDLASFLPSQRISPLHAYTLRYCAQHRLLPVLQAYLDFYLLSDDDATTNRYIAKVSNSSEWRGPDWLAGELLLRTGQYHQAGLLNALVWCKIEVKPEKESSDAMIIYKMCTRGHSMMALACLVHDHSAVSPVDLSVHADAAGPSIAHLRVLDPYFKQNKALYSALFKDSRGQTLQEETKGLESLDSVEIRAQRMHACIIEALDETVGFLDETFAKVAISEEMETYQDSMQDKLENVEAPKCEPHTHDGVAEAEKHTLEVENKRRFLGSPSGYRDMRHMLLAPYLIGMCFTEMEYCRIENIVGGCSISNLSSCAFLLEPSPYKLRTIDPRRPRTYNIRMSGSTSSAVADRGNYNAIRHDLSQAGSNSQTSSDVGDFSEVVVGSKYRVNISSVYGSLKLPGSKPTQYPRSINQENFSTLGSQRCHRWSSFTYEYFLRTHRPLNAILAYLKSSRAKSTQVYATVISLGLAHLTDESVRKACLVFLEILGLDSHQFCILIRIATLVFHHQYTEWVSSIQKRIDYDSGFTMPPKKDIIIKQLQLVEDALSLMTPLLPVALGACHTLPEEFTLVRQMLEKISSNAREMQRYPEHSRLTHLSNILPAFDLLFRQPLSIDTLLPPTAEAAKFPWHITEFTDRFFRTARIYRLPLLECLRILSRHAEMCGIDGQARVQLPRAKEELWQDFLLLTYLRLSFVDRKVVDVVPLQGSSHVKAHVVGLEEIDILLMSAAVGAASDRRCSTSMCINYLSTFQPAPLLPLIAACMSSSRICNMRFHSLSEKTLQIPKITYQLASTRPSESAGLDLTTTIQGIDLGKCFLEISSEVAPPIPAVSAMRVITAVGGFLRDDIVRYPHDNMNSQMNDLTNSFKQFLVHESCPSSDQPCPTESLDKIVGRYLREGTVALDQPDVTTACAHKIEILEKAVRFFDPTSPLLCLVRFTLAFHNRRYQHCQQLLESFVQSVKILIQRSAVLAPPKKSLLDMHHPSIFDSRCILATAVSYIQFLLNRLWSRTKFAFAMSHPQLGTCESSLAEKSNHQVFESIFLIASLHISGFWSLHPAVESHSTADEVSCRESFPTEEVKAVYDEAEGFTALIDVCWMDVREILASTERESNPNVKELDGKLFECITPFELKEIFSSLSSIRQAVRSHVGAHNEQSPSTPWAKLSDTSMISSVALETLDENEAAHSDSIDSVLGSLLQNVQNESTGEGESCRHKQILVESLQKLQNELQSAGLWIFEEERLMYWRECHEALQDYAMQGESFFMQNLESFMDSDTPLTLQEQEMMLGYVKRYRLRLDTTVKSMPLSRELSNKPIFEGWEDLTCLTMPIDDRLEAFLEKSISIPSKYAEERPPAGTTSIVRLPTLLHDYFGESPEVCVAVVLLPC